MAKIVKTQVTAAAKSAVAKAIAKTALKVGNKAELKAATKKSPLADKLIARGKKVAGVVELERHIGNEQAAQAAQAKATPAPAPARSKAVVPATPALDAAAAPKPATKVANEVINDVTATVVCRRRGMSYTCIRLAIGPTHTHFISLERLAVTKVPNREFHEEWEEYNTYPVRRAAELYLNTPHRELEPQARRHLERIVADPTTVYVIDGNNQLKEENQMATAKKPTANTKTAAAKDEGKTASPAAKAPAAKTAAKTAPAAKQPAAKAPAKQPAAKAPAKQPAAKAPAKQPAKQANGIATVVSGAKPPAKQAASVQKPAASRAPNDEKLKVADPSVARRGVTAEFQEEAVKMKNGFTRQQLIDKMVGKGHDAAAARIKVADMVYFKILVPA